MFLRCWLLMLFLLLGSSSPALAFFGGATEYSTLAELTNAIAAETREMMPGARLYLDRDDIRDLSDDSSSPFAALLQHALETSLGAAGFHFEEVMIDKADFRVTARYQQNLEHVQISLRFKDTKDPTNSSFKTLKKNYRIARNKLPPDCFTLTVDDYLGRLVKKISAKGNKGARTTRLVINQAVEARKGYSSPFGEYVTQRLKTLFASAANMKVLEEKPSLAKMAAPRTDAARGAVSADALLADADAVLVDTYLGSADDLTLTATLQERNGSVIARADERIPLALIKHSLENDAAEQTASLADTEHEKSGDAVSIRTTKGGGRHQFFRTGETVQFAVKVSKALYVYIYDINPQGEVALLYPKQGEPEQPLTPELLFTIPDVSDSWEIKVEPPYGTDAVKVFASTRKLRLPRINNRLGSRSFSNGTRALVRQEKVQQELARETAINGRDLVDYYKGVAKAKQAPLYEATVFVETRGN